MADPTQFPGRSDPYPPKMVDSPRGITVTHMLIHAVLVCDCPTHLVLLANFADPVECPACKQKWQLQGLHFNMETNTDTGQQQGKLEFKFAALNRVTIPPGLPS